MREKENAMSVKEGVGTLGGRWALRRAFVRRRMKLLTMALSSLLCSVPLCTSASVASGSLLATIGACTANADLWSFELPHHRMR